MPKAQEIRFPCQGQAVTVAPFWTPQSGIHLKRFCSRTTKGCGHQIWLLCRWFIIWRQLIDPVHLVWPALPLLQQFRSRPRGRHRHVLRLRGSLGGEAGHLSEQPAASSAVTRASSWLGLSWSKGLEHGSGTRASAPDAQPVLSGKA